MHDEQVWFLFIERSALLAAVFSLGLETNCEKSAYTALHTTRESVREKFLRLLYQTRKPTERFEHKIENQTEFGRRGGKNNFEKLRLIRAG